MDYDANWTDTVYNKKRNKEVFLFLFCCKEVAKQRKYESNFSKYSCKTIDKKYTKCYLNQRKGIIYKKYSCKYQNKREESLMQEYKINMILDGGSYKASYTKDGRQLKVTIGNEKVTTVMAARKVSKEVEELMNSSLELIDLKKMYAINRDAERCGYHCSVIRFQNVSIEIAVKIMFPDSYEEFIKSEDFSQIKIEDKPLEILNVGCTGSGKTRFILSAVLSNSALKNFVPALTSLKETTACSIVYHINSSTQEMPKECDFKLIVELKSKEEIYVSIKALIVEAVEEYIVTIKENCKKISVLSELCKKCRGTVAKRLELNYDKTFGLGIRNLNNSLSVSIEELTKSALIDFYGSSKSIDKMAEKDSDFIIKQLIRDYEDEQFDISSDEIEAMLEAYNNEAMITTIYSELEKDLEAYNKEYSSESSIGEILTYFGHTEDAKTLDYLSHVFGNKSKQRKGDFYTIEPVVKKAEFYLQIKNMSYDREIILSDSIGINQGQKDAARISEVVFNRVQEAVQSRKPDIILYHTKLNNKDDYMLDIIKKLNAQGYGQSTYVVAGRLDEVLSTYLTDKYMEKDDMTEAIFDDFVEETKQIYVDSDSVTLNSIIGEKYLICDKTNKIAENADYAFKYTCPMILEHVITEVLGIEKSNCHYDDVDFMEIIQNNDVAGNVYRNYLDSIPRMIPLAYNQMRWNTLQRAIEELRWDGYGFDVLYPAFNIKNAIAYELNRDEIRSEFAKKFREDAEEMKRRYLLEVAEVAQIVLVTEYRMLMKRLLAMRNDIVYRTNLNLTMTDDRKYNLHRLYNTCLEQDGVKGAYVLKIVFHIAWIRTLEYFKRKAG